MNHAILTRFNLPSPGHESILREAPGWLEDRFAIFERYCLPSVAAQGCKAFRWLIYFDPKTPDWAKQKIDRHAAAALYIPLYRTTVPKPQLLDDIRAAHGGTDAVLLTTRLDNDDMIGPNFVGRLQRAAEPLAGHRTVLNFPNGYTLCDGRAYWHSDKSNAFASMVEPWEGALSIWHDRHTQLAAVAPILQLDDAPAWIQLIHGRNVSNRVRGRLADPRALATFPLPADELVPQSRAALLADRLYSTLFRDAWEAVRSAIVRLIRVLLPARVLDRLKSALARGRADPHNRS